MRIAIVIVLLWLFGTAAHGQLTTTLAGGKGSGVVAIPCNAGALDLSLATGCNLQFYLNMVFP